MSNNVFPDTVDVNVVSPNPLPVDVASSVTIDVNVVSPNPLPVQIDDSVTLDVNIASPNPLPVDANIAKTAFGEVQVAQLKPLLQVTAQYGLRNDVLQVNLGGTTTSVDSKFIASTGVGVNNVSAIVSARQATYRAGQGLLARFTALFSEGKVNSNQQSGFLTSESAFTFGFNGADFGIMHSRDGALEQQDLLVTVGASGAENAVVFIDGNSYTVPLTGGTASETAYEIAESLKAQVLGYSFSSVDDSVCCLAQLPDFGAGLFSFSSATAVAAFTEVAIGTLPTETWVNKADWNVNPSININPSLGNVYQIQLQYLGFGGIRFFIENPETAQFELVHIIKYANSSAVPSVKNPIFRIGWACRNTGNNTDIVVQGASGAIFIEGQLFFDGDKRGFGVNQIGIGTSSNIGFSIFSLQNRLTYFNTANRAEILLKALAVSTDSGKSAVFTLVKNPVLVSGEFLEFQSLTSDDLAQASTSVAEVVGGDIISVFSIKSQGSFQADVVNTVSSLLPGDILCVVAKVSSGAASEMEASITWQDDL